METVVITTRTYIIRAMYLAHDLKNNNIGKSNCRINCNTMPLLQMIMITIVIII